MTSEAVPPHDAHNAALLKVLLMRARKLYADVCEELEYANPEADEYCLLLSNFADDLAAFISGMDRLKEMGAWQW